MLNYQVKELLKILGFIFLLILAMPASAMDLLDAYQLGLKNDPAYQGAVATYQAEKEANPRAWSGVFPQISANADISRLKSHLIGDGTAHLESYSYGVNLSQVIFDFSVFKRISAASASVKQAAYNLAAAKQDLILRVSRAYFNVLLAQDNLSFTRRQRDAALQQLNATKERFKVGHATITSLNQLKGQYELLRAQTYSDKIALSNQLQALDEIIGTQTTNLAPLKHHFALKKPQPTKLSTWIQVANQKNLPLTAARFGLDAARKEMGVAQGNHLPTLSASASFERSKSPSTLTLIDTEKSSVGLSLNFPIFEGGAINSQIREARAQFESAEAALSSAYRATLSGTISSYQALVYGVSQLQTGSAAVTYNKKALAHVEEGYNAGIQTTEDVIQQQNRLLEAQRTYARNRYNYLANILLLQQAVGTLKPESLVRISALAIASHKKNVTMSG